MVFGMPMTLSASPCRHRFLGDLLRPAKRPVSADGKEDADLQVHKRLDHLGRVLGTAGGAQHRTADRMDPVDRIGRQFERFVSDPLHKSFIAVAEPVDLLHSVMMDRG